MDINVTPELAEICGIHAGDGYMRFRKTGKGEVQICGHLEEREYYNNHVIPLFSNFFKIQLQGKVFSNKAYGFVCYKSEIRDSLFELGFPAGKKSDIVRVPKAIMESKDRKLYAGFLRGIFDTDGNLYFRKSYAGVNKFNLTYNHYPIISIVTVSKFLAEDIIRMLHEFDILFSYASHDSKKKAEARKYTITISGRDGLEFWMNNIGTKNSVKSSRYLVWKKQGFCSPNTTLEKREGILNPKENLV